MQKTQRYRKWLFFPMVFLGITIVVLQMNNRSQPEKSPIAEESHTVRVITVPITRVRPRLMGTGNVVPAQVWSGVVQVSGTVIDVHPKLEKGAIITANEILLTIDPSDYELAIAQIDSSIDSIKAQLAETTIKEQNARSSLKIEQEALKSAEAEHERKRKLVAKGTISSSDFEKDKRDVLKQQQNMQLQRNTLNLYPAEKRRLQAEFARLEVQLSAARLNLERTVINMPFTGRIAEVHTEKMQYVRQGEVAVIADSMDKAEIEVQLSMAQFAGLIRSSAAIELDKIQMRNIGELLGLSARVILNDKRLNVAWPGKVVRISDTLDLQTRTIGVIIEVDKPYENTQPGIRPPLLKGLFVDIELQGRILHDRLVIPYSALHGQQVYTVSAENRLIKNPVTVELAGAGYVVIAGGLSNQDRIVISDVIPAIEGMLLEPVDAPAVLHRLIRDVGGKPEGLAP